MITALLVSVNYSDYLEVALPYNTKQFDEIIVLTIESDKSCQDLCSKYSNVNCLVFPDEILKKNGRTFNKGALMNKGFEHLNEIGYSDWLVLTDSDIVFPENFKELFLSKEKDPNILYGMNRKYCLTKSLLNEYLKSRDINLLTVNARGIYNNMIGIGFCQIFMYEANKFTLVESTNANTSDIRFVNDYFGSFCNVKSLKDDIFVIHLGETCKNWWGRTTKPFV